MFILALSMGVFGDEVPGPNGFTKDELHDTVAAVWTVDEVRPAKLYAVDTQTEQTPAAIVDFERDEKRSPHDALLPCSRPQVRGACRPSRSRLRPVQ